MNILYVINNAFTQGNGLTASCRRTIKYLRMAGENVEVLSAADPNGLIEPAYKLPDYTMPIFDRLVKKQGYAFADTDEYTMRKAVDWADVVHLEEPFVTEKEVCRIAEEMGTPVVATYHLHPENLFASVNFDKPWLNKITLKLWEHMVFNKCEIIQCPTKKVKERLEKHHVKAELRVISNGIIPDEEDEDSLPSPPTSPYIVVCTGRYSAEKDQSTLLEAMRYCENSKNIQLVFAGKGPLEKKLKKRAAELLKQGVLNTMPTFDFYNQKQLRNLYAQSSLYIHCAYVEVEGLSCLEAIQTGLVPVIAEGEMSAASQFALSPESLFPAKDPKVLAQRIDYWLSNDDRRREEAEKYTAYREQYDIKKSVTQLIEMYEDALAMKKKQTKKQLLPVSTDRELIEASRFSVEATPEKQCR